MQIGVEDVEAFDEPQGLAVNRDMMVILGKGPKQMKHTLRMIEMTGSKGNSVRIITGEARSRAKLEAESNIQRATEEEMSPRRRWNQN